MSTKRIDGFPDAAPLTGNERILIEQGLDEMAVTKKATLSAVAEIAVSAVLEDAEEIAAQNLLAATTAATAAQTSAATAATSLAAVEVAIATASGGTVGPMVTAGGFDLAVRLRAEGSEEIIAGFDTDGYLIYWDGTEFQQFTGITLASITEALGFAPANGTDLAEAVYVRGGPMVTVGGFDLAFSVRCEVTGRVVFGITTDGEAVAWVDSALRVVGSGGGGITANPARIYDFDTLTGALLDEDDVVDAVFGIGQSLAVASLGAVAGDTAFSTTAYDPGFSRTFDAGVWPRSAAIDALVDLANPSDQETAGPMMFSVVQDRLQARFGRRRQMLWGVAGAGGLPYSEMKRGTLIYSELLAMVAAGARLAKAEARRLVVRGIWVRHGEADLWRSPDAYGAEMMQIRRDAETDIRAITGQIEPVYLFLTQPTRSSGTATDPGTATGMMLAAQRDPFCRMFGPIYYARHKPEDSAHPFSLGYAAIGEVNGYALADELYGPGFVPTFVESAYWVTGGATPVLELRYSRPVVRDAAWELVPADGLAASGFNFYNGASAITISSVSPVAAALTATVSGSTLTLGPGTISTLGVRTNGDMSDVGLTVTVNGVRFDLLCEISDALSLIATRIAAAFAGATASGFVVTFSGSPTITASVATKFVRLTLASAPTLRPRLHYATASTAPVGDYLGLARGLIREWRRLGLSATAGTPPLYHPACVQIIDLPRI